MSYLTHQMEHIWKGEAPLKKKKKEGDGIVQYITFIADRQDNLSPVGPVSNISKLPNSAAQGNIRCAPVLGGEPQCTEVFH